MLPAWLSIHLRKSLDRSDLYTLYSFICAFLLQLLANAYILSLIHCLMMLKNFFEKERQFLSPPPAAPIFVTLLFLKQEASTMY